MKKEKMKMFKSFYKSELKKIGINRHPLDGRSLSSHNTTEIQKLYIKYVLNK